MNLSRTRLKQTINILERARKADSMFDMTQWQSVLPLSANSIVFNEETLHTCSNSACVVGYVAVSKEWFDAGGLKTETGQLCTELQADITYIKFTAEEVKAYRKNAEDSHDFMMDSDYEVELDDWVVYSWFSGFNLLRAPTMAEVLEVKEMDWVAVQALCATSNECTTKGYDDWWKTLYGQKKPSSIKIGNAIDALKSLMRVAKL